MSVRIVLIFLSYICASCALAEDIAVATMDYQGHPIASPRPS